MKEISGVLTFKFDGDELIIPAGVVLEEEKPVFDFSMVDDAFFNKILILKSGFERILHNPMFAQKYIESMFEGLPDIHASEKDQINQFAHASALAVFSNYIRSNDDFEDMMSFAKQNHNAMQLGVQVRELYFNHPTKSSEEIYVQIVKDIMQSEQIKSKINDRYDSESAKCFLNYIPLLAYRQLLIKKNKLFDSKKNKGYRAMLNKMNNTNVFRYFEFVKNKDSYYFN